MFACSAAAGVRRLVQLPRRPRRMDVRGAPARLTSHQSPNVEFFFCVIIKAIDGEVPTGHSGCHAVSGTVRVWERSSYRFPSLLLCLLEHDTMAHVEHARVEVLNKIMQSGDQGGWDTGKGRWGTMWPISSAWTLMGSVQLPSARADDVNSAHERIRKMST